MNPFCLKGYDKDISQVKLKTEVRSLFLKIPKGDTTLQTKMPFSVTIQEEVNTAQLDIPPELNIHFGHPSRKVIDLCQ